MHAEPTKLLRLILALLPFAVIVTAYLIASHVRLEANPSDKLTPSVSKMVEAVGEMALTKDKRTGRYLMLADTLSSLRRIVIGLGAAAIVGLFLGMTMGLFPGMNSTLHPVVRFLSIIPPLAILPILFIVFGVGEVGKIVLIFIGSLFVITRDIHEETRQLPREQIVKALTLGASQFQVLWQVVLPQIMPRLLITVRLCLGGAWLFLIASEAIASTDGLGYRIFLVRRYLAMDIIIPYVLWITLIGLLMDTALRLVVNWKYRWYVASQ
ncbi:MAG: ABC transporter permease [Desulfomonile tiedjei]|uniref:ABC transporter permease n=1 Tax=Desulfomonile tiedjei TaxID=2358 RepID=A0A9D6Z2H6_9BACT|nr:ABC transporter permease [Desulfomonile tiedjei]